MNNKSLTFLLYQDLIKDDLKNLGVKGGYQEYTLTMGWQKKTSQCYQEGESVHSAAIEMRVLAEGHNWQIMNSAEKSPLKLAQSVVTINV